MYLKNKDKPPCHILVLDLDGTLMNSRKEITKNTKEALFRFMDNGGCVVLASGRPTYGIIPVANELELNKRGGYILSYNGGCIMECKTGEIIYQQTLKEDDVKTLAEQAKSHGVNILTYEGSLIITENDHDTYSKKESMITKMLIKKVDSFDDYVNFPVVKCLMTAEAEYLVNVEKSVKSYWGDRLSISRSEPFFLEVTAKGIDKAKSLERLLQKLNMDKSCMIACGDGFNDQSMIEFAGFGVAMGNAQEIVKAAADYIAPTNDEDGVAYVMEHLMQ
ncbi:MAG: Cof-type HAD-IIB family hydrolase [Herbinix sp.]|nr:Cof-type HAD-IIB family hydrolase [Herbinix sp.]